MWCLLQKYQHGLQYTIFFFSPSEHSDTSMMANKSQCGKIILVPATLLRCASVDTNLISVSEKSWVAFRQDLWAQPTRRKRDGVKIHRGTWGAGGHTHTHKHTHDGSKNSAMLHQSCTWLGFRIRAPKPNCARVSRKGICGRCHPSNNGASLCVQWMNTHKRNSITTSSYARPVAHRRCRGHFRPKSHTRCQLGLDLQSTSQADFS